MKFISKQHCDDFLKAVERARGNVWLVSTHGDRFNLKSTMMRYVALGKLCTESGDSLELFCDLKDDEALFLEFFHNNPDVI